MGDFLNIIGNIIWGLCIVITLGWCLKVREKAKNEQATEKSFELLGLLFSVSVILIFLLSLSPFHLIWMMPTSYILSLLSMISPLRLLWPFSSLYFLFWYIGIRNIGREYYLSGDYDKAIDAYKEEISKKPKSSQAHFNLGLAYGKIGQNDKEIESYKKAISLKPNVPEMHYNLGIAYTDSGNIQKAIEALNEAIRLRPNYSKAHFAICKRYVEIGDKENALKEYELVKNRDVILAEELSLII